MATVAAPISDTVATSTLLRPNRSPKWPASTPPTGRATKPTENVRNASRVPVSGSKDGKNTSLNTSAAAEP